MPELPDRKDLTHFLSKDSSTLFLVQEFLADRRQLILEGMPRANVDEFVSLKAQIELIDKLTRSLTEDLRQFWTKRQDRIE